MSGAILTVLRVGRAAGAVRYRVTIQASDGVQGCAAVEVSCLLDRGRLTVFWPGTWGTLAPDVLALIAATLRDIDRDRVVISSAVVAL